LLSKYAERICLAFSGAEKYLQKHRSKLVVTGNPVRQIIGRVDKQSALKYWKFSGNDPVLLVFGGSQGARAINNALQQILPEILQQTNLQIIWQTGERDFQRLKANFLFPEERVRMFPYIEEMEFAYAAADLIISRAGAITLAELALIAKPAILIPYPYAAGNHQLHNAQWIADQGAALIVTEGENFVERLKETILQLLKDSDKQDFMKKAWKKIAIPDASEKIVIEVLKLLTDKKLATDPNVPLKMNSLDGAL